MESTLKGSCLSGDNVVPVEQSSLYHPDLLFVLKRDLCKQTNVTLVSNGLVGLGF
jgi:hypothetical protein